MIQAIVGANWGDEGKGKITDYLSTQADIVVRYQGGNNAGHTVINGYGKFALHLLPSGVFNPHTVNILGPGVALNIDDFLNELQSIIDRGVPIPKIYISERAQVVLPWHQKFDTFEEERLGEKQFGSTKMGIAPFYGDKCLKIGIQVAELFDEALLKDRVATIIQMKNCLAKHLYHQEIFDVDAVFEHLKIQRDRIAPYLIDSTDYLYQAVKRNQSILMEGQLGALRDLDHGIYPFTSSSSVLAGFSAIGGGIPPWAIHSIIAVVKAYSTCVGAGSFVTEIHGDVADELRERGGDCGEYGATTKRPRRMGWFDGVATRYGCRIQGATSIAVTCLDVLGYMDEIPVCTGYEIDGQVTDKFPVTPLLNRAHPVYQNLEGWKCDVSRVRCYEDLPRAARNYIEWIEAFVGLQASIISVGSKRDEIILRTS